MQAAAHETIELPAMASKASAVWLAATKLHAPARRRDALLRPRLIDSLRQSLEQSRLTLISAPAGAGKTSLLAELPHAFPEYKWAWLLLDTEDNDPLRFVAALLASLEAAGVPVEEDAFDIPDARQRATAIINGLTRHTDRCALVLDDLHTIPDRSVHEVLDYLVANAPPNLRLVLASRVDPPMSLARHRARGDMSEIRLHDLSFTEEETGALANRCLGLNLNPSEVSALYSRTEGWAAGLRLLATSFAQLPSNRTAILESGMQGSRRIFDFLAEEVLDRQEPELRSFLLETSILTSLRPNVCNLLTGRRDSAQVLEDLYRRNLYVVAADESETSFRYHDLFADFLRERLQRERPDDVLTLHEQAANAETLPHNRLRHLLAAESWDAAASQIEAIGAEYAAQGFVATLRRWISACPEEIRLKHPRVTYLLAFTIWTQRDFSDAQPYIETALEGFRRTQDIQGQGEALAALAGSIFVNNRFAESRELLKEALNFDLPDSSRITIFSIKAWDAMYHRDWANAEANADVVYGMLERGVGSTNPLALMVALYSTHLGKYVDWLERVCSAMHARLPGQPDLAFGCYYLLHSAVLLNRGDLAGAVEEARKALAIARDAGQILLPMSALCTTFCITGAAEGNWEEMDRWSVEALREDKYGQIVRNWRLHYLYMQAWARWHGGNLEGLRATFEDALKPNPLEAPPSTVYRTLIRGMLRMAERAYGQAEQTFREALREEESFRVTFAVSSARMCLAHVLLVRGQTAEAVETFAPLLQIAEEGNLVGQLTRGNPIVVPLLRLAHERNVRRSYCERVLELLGAPLNPIEASGGEGLSERELEVLRVMAEGLANKEIAARLFVSEATVKTHVQRILRKLDAGTRTQAVARARDLLLV